MRLHSQRTFTGSLQVFMNVSEFFCCNDLQLRFHKNWEPKNWCELVIIHWNQWKLTDFHHSCDSAFILKTGWKNMKEFHKGEFWRTGLVVITRWRNNFLSVKRDMGTMGKRSLAPGIDSKASITENSQRQGPGLDGHLLFSFVLIESKNIFAQKGS